MGMTTACTCGKPVHIRKTGESDRRYREKHAAELADRRQQRKAKQAADAAQAGRDEIRSRPAVTSGLVVPTWM